MSWSLRGHPDFATHRAAAEVNAGAFADTKDEPRVVIAFFAMLHDALRGDGKAAAYRGTTKGDCTELHTLVVFRQGSNYWCRDDFLGKAARRLSTSCRRPVHETAIQRIARLDDVDAAGSCIYARGNSRANCRSAQLRAE